MICSPAVPETKSIEIVFDAARGNSISPKAHISVARGPTSSTRGRQDPTSNPTRLNCREFTTEGGVTIKGA